MKTKILLLIIFAAAAGLIIVGLNFIDGGDGFLKSKDFQPIELKEVFRIVGEDGDERYFLKYPANLKVDGAGNVYVLDIDQLLVFDRQGKFLKNLMKKGQGPGELLRISNYLIQDNIVMVHDHSPNKIVKLDISGKFIEEFRVYSNAWIDLFFADQKRLYFLAGIAADTKGKGKVIDLERKLIAFPKDEISETETKADELFIFPVKTFAYRTPTAYFTIALNTLKSCHLKDSLFFVSNTQAYEVKLIDIEKKKVLKKIKPSYKRVRVTKETEPFVPYGQVLLDGTMYRSPRPEYFNDIQAICCSNNMLWVFTSTVDDKKGVRVDRWDFAGKYIDQVFVKFPHRDTHYRIEQGTVAISDGFLTIIERDKNDNRMIIKYKMGI